MKQKIYRYRNRSLVIKGNPQFGKRVVKPAKGKGSYKRLTMNKTDYLERVFTLIALPQ